MMNQGARTALVQLVSKYGQAFCDDPRRAEALLRDTCGEHRREVSVLMGALRERIPAELAASQSGTPIPIVIGRLASRLEDQLGLAPDPARWAVESWALALGVVTAAEIAQTPSSAAPAAMPANAAVPAATTTPSVTHPASVADSRHQFLMTIEGVFFIRGRGTVVTGRVQAGAIRRGAQVEISRGDRVITAVVASIEQFRTLVAEARTGDNVGILLEGVSREDVAAGDVMRVRS